MKQMRWVVLLFLVVSAASAAERDAKADAVGQELLTSLGGPAVFEKARQFQFDFVVEAEGKAIARLSHVWDRYTGDYRLAGTEKTGAPFTVYFNVNTRQGKAFVNGRPAEPTRQEELLKMSYERFINDTYWLLAPWKIFDPGVHLAYDGEKPCPNGGDCDVLKISFEEGVGLTPKDIYWLWITRQGRQMVAWQYVLGGAQEEPTTALWTSWKKFAGVSLSVDKPISGKPVAIRFENVSVSPARDDSLFAPPAAP
ncbi:MAG: hypothetical protein ACRD1B_02695 [Thermoanaerobaculia bacterium]